MFQIFRNTLSNLKLKRQLLLNLIHRLCIKINTKLIIKYNKPCSIFNEIELHIQEKKLCSPYSKVKRLYKSLYNHNNILHEKHALYNGLKICVITFQIIEHKK